MPSGSKLGIDTILAISTILNIFNIANIVNIDTVGNIDNIGNMNNVSNIINIDNIHRGGGETFKAWKFSLISVYAIFCHFVGNSKDLGSSSGF